MIVTMRNDQRQSWDDYFRQLAHAAATRSTCTRRQVGAVVVRDRRIVSTGYNGAPANVTHCADGGCPRATSGVPSGHTDYSDCVAIHGEVNAVLMVPVADRRSPGTTLYTTDAPCWECSKVIANSGISEVVSSANPDGEYDSWERSKSLLQQAGVRVRLLDLTSADAAAVLLRQPNV